MSAYIMIALEVLLLSISVIGLSVRCIALANENAELKRRLLFEYLRGAGYSSIQRLESAE